MSKNFTAKKVTRIGLDIGTRAIKALEVSSEGGVRRLIKIHHTEVAPPSGEDKIAAAVKALMDGLRPSVKDVNISLSSPHAIVRFINMPKMSAADLKNSLRFEAEKYIPFNIKEVVTDAAILGFITEDKRQMRVLFAAVKRKILDSRVNMLKNIGFSTSLVDIDSFAFFNAFCNSAGSLDESKSIALLNIGYSHTNLVVSQGANPFFSRDIQIGAKDMTKDIANLADELSLSFGYYENQYGKSISEIYISGGAAHLDGILKHFEERFAIKTALWDPFSKFEIGPGIEAKSPEALRPQFAVSAGLALRQK